MPNYQISLLCLFGFLAGFVDAIVGGGGLIQLPAFLMLRPELPLLSILATNKTASFSGTAVAAVRYARRIRIRGAVFWPMAALAFTGALGGALLASHIRREVFLPVILAALAAVLAYTVLRRELGQTEQPERRSRRMNQLLAGVSGLVIGFYDGLIGPGTGSFLIFLFVIVFGLDFLQSAAHAKLINCITNLAAVGLFLAQGAVRWPIAIPLALSNMAGNYLGAHLSLRSGNRFIRVAYIVIVSALLCKLGYEYLK